MFFFRPHRWSCCLPEAQVQLTPCKSPSSSPKVLSVRLHTLIRQSSAVSSEQMKVCMILKHNYAFSEKCLFCYHLEIGRLVAGQLDRVHRLPAGWPGERNRCKFIQQSHSKAWINVGQLKKCCVCMNSWCIRYVLTTGVIFSAFLQIRRSPIGFTLRN